jgi:hypothetical protein
MKRDEKLSPGVTFKNWRDAACSFVLGLVAFWFSWGVLRQRALRGEGSPSYDIYAYFYPNILYALRALQDGHGLLWNRLQNCGQPFFANPQTALLYPPNWIFLLLDVDAALIILPALHLLIGAFGTYALCRQIGLRRSSALAGSLAFQLGGNAVALAAWMPNISGAYAWMPVAAWLLEKVLRTGTVYQLAALVVVLAVQLFAGYPQIAFFTYLILLVRIAWKVATEPAGWRTAALAALALIVAPLLASIQLLPGAEMAAESVRSAALATSESDLMVVSWQKLRELAEARATGPGTTFSLIACALAGAGLWNGRRSGVVGCYALLALLFMLLSFDNVFSQAYRLLPMSSTFRGLDRFLWPAGFCFSVLVAFGVESIHLARTDRRGHQSSRAFQLFGGLVLGATTYLWLGRWASLPWEWALAVTLAAVVVSLARRPGVRATYAMIVVALLGANLVALARGPQHSLLGSAPAVLRRNATAFVAVRERLTVENRIVAAGENPDFSVMRKSPSVFGIPGIADYEPLTSRRYAEYYVKMMYGARNDLWMDNLNQFYYMTSAVPGNLPLLNLTAARFLTVDLRNPAPSTSSRFSLLRQFGSVSLFENPGALPRAFFIPLARVIPEKRDVLRTLSSRTFPVRDLALLTETPADGFLGVTGSIGSARIDSDQSEVLTLTAFSDSGGFVFVADQFYPGWIATVNDVAMPILNANYAFRLVRIPPGASTVVFRYEPTSLRAGATISIVTLLSLCAAMVANAVRRRRWPASA